MTDDSASSLHIRGRKAAHRSTSEGTQKGAAGLLVILVMNKAQARGREMKALGKPAAPDSNPGTSVFVFVLLNKVSNIFQASLKLAMWSRMSLDF